MEKKESKLYMKKKERKQAIFNEAKLIKKTCDHKVENELALDVIDAEKMLVKCKLCGERFSAKAIPQDELHHAIDVVLDAINSIKLKGEYGNRSYLPLETRKSLAVTQLLLESVPEFYKDYFLENLDENHYNSEYNNGPCEISSDGGLIIGGASKWNKPKKRNDIDSLLKKEKHKKHYNEKNNKDKDKKKKKNKNNWY